VERFVIHLSLSRETGPARFVLNYCCGTSLFVLLPVLNIRKGIHKETNSTFFAKILSLDCKYQLLATSGSNPLSCANSSKRFLCRVLITIKK
jgi:hypothetical protein